MAAPEAPSRLSVTVCYAEPERVWTWAVTLAAGSTLADAIAASGYATAFPGRDPYACGVGIYGIQRPSGHPLEDGDRVEIYRPLVFDPKESRRRRAAHKSRRATDAPARD